MKPDSAICLGCILVFLSAMAVAQTPERKAVPSDERKRLLDAMPTLPIDPTAILPRAELVYGRGLASVAHIRVTHIVLESATVLTKDEVAKLVAPLEGREVTIEELHELRRRLSEEYVRRGYVNSGVVLPDQEVVQGVVVMREVTGKLTNVEVKGNGRLSQAYIRDRINGARHEPLRVEDLQKALELLQQDPLIQRINARLIPGVNTGEAELQVSVKRTSAFQVAIGVDNQRSASTGGEQATVAVAHLNVTGHGDLMTAEAGASMGRTIGGLSYSYPLTARNTSIHASFSVDDGRIVEEPFRIIDIKSLSMRGALSVSTPLVQRPNKLLVASAGIERKHSESTLLGIPFSFSPGDRDGESDTTVLNFGLEYTLRSQNQVFSFRGTGRQGIDALNATTNPEGPDGRFTAFLGQFQYARRGPAQSELLFRSTAQLADGPLLGLEKMPIGGFHTVRGYRENQYVRDNGVAVSVEWRVPLPLGRRAESGFDALNLRVAPFLDYGRSWDTEAQPFTPDSVDASSAGIGLLWNPIRGLRADAYWGHPFKKPRTSGKDIQDRGIHFMVSYMLPL